MYNIFEQKVYDLYFQKENPYSQSRLFRPFPIFQMFVCMLGWRSWCDSVPIFSSSTLYHQLKKTTFYFSFLAHLSWTFLIIFISSSVCPTVWKYLTCFTSPSESPGQFYPNLVKGVQIDKNEGQRHFQGEIR